MQITRESIFISSVRAFFNAFFALVGVLIGLVIVALILGSAFTTQPQLPTTTIVVEPDANGSTAMLPATAPVVLRIDLNGPIIPPNISYQMIEKQLIDSRQGLFKNDRVKAILLCCNTPGGTVNDSYAIYQRLMEYKKRYNVPIYSFTEGLCASGGVIVSSAADKALCNPISIIGAVGVILGPAFNFAELIDSLGIKAKLITEGKSKAVLPRWTPWSPNEGEELIPIAKQSYDVFLDIVTQARKNLSREKLVNEYGARVFDAPTAQKYGYVEDSNATYVSALNELVEAAGIEGEYQVIRLKTRTNYLGSLIQNGPLGMLKKSWAGSHDKLLYLYQSP